MGQPKGCAGLHGCKYPRVQLCLSSASQKPCYHLYLIAWHYQRNLGALKPLQELHVCMGLFLIATGLFSPGLHQR